MYTEPTATDLKARFPEFASVADPTLDLILAEAIGQVGETWIERDRRPAQLYLAAHMLAMEGEPARSSGATGGGVTGPMKSRTVGDVRTEFAGFSGAGGATTDAGYETTAYGKQFLRLLRLNFPPIAVI